MDDLTRFPHVLRDDTDLAAGLAGLLAVAPRFQHVVDLGGALSLRQAEAGFQGLFNAIVSQQVSVAAARAIKARLADAGLDQERAILSANDEALRGCGLSRQKVKYLKGIAAADLDYAALAHAPTDYIVTSLVALPGIGKWTAEIYAMFSLLRADVFAPGDLALQEAAKRLFALPERPSEGALRKLSLDWAPWRAVAARLLWSYYRIDKGREGI